MLNVKMTSRGALLLLSVLFLTALMCWAEESAHDLPETCTEKYSLQYPEHTRCLEDHPECTAIEVTEVVKAAVLAKHNEYRKELFASNMMKLQWSEELAITARKWAMQNKGGHDDNRRLESGAPVGQNAFGGSGDRELVNATVAWANEKPLFNYTHYNIKAGHYHAVINAKTYEIGCGGSKCHRDGDPPERYWTRWVCNYYPPVYSNAKAFGIGEPCMDCNTTCDANFLCDCDGNAPTCNTKRGRLNPSSCKCECDKMYEDGNTCDVRTCPEKDYYTWCENRTPDDPYCPKAYYQKVCPFNCGICTTPGETLPPE